MRLVDSHAHLDFSEFGKDIEEVIIRAKNVGVDKIINIGADLVRSKKAIEIAEKYGNIWATVGIHPEEAHKIDINKSLQELEKSLKTSRKIIAIGECGLDYFWSEKEINVLNIKKLQQELFVGQLKLAKKYNLPVVVHIRNGSDDFAAIEAFKILVANNIKNGVIHCFTLNRNWARKFTDLGFFIGFTGIITYKNSDIVCETVSYVDINKILIETDCPFLAPQKFRGKRNESAYVVEVATRIAEIKNIEIEQVCEYTTKNAEKLFNI
jgi:TatD DNase family protein